MAVPENPIEGGTTRPIIAKRHYFSNRGSNLRRSGDPLRGDLPIVPFRGNWFAPSVQPSKDLQAGGLMVIGGVNNENSQKVAKLIFESGGGYSTTIGGVDHADLDEQSEGFVQKNTILASGGTQDVIVTAFP
jgi:hypothetical protein